MTKRLTPDICVIGGGSAGLSIAAGAAQMGADTVLIERAEMGGDCLNVGCVPSKSLLVAGKAAQAFKRAARLGVDYPAPEIDFERVHDHVHGVIGAIAPMDSVERFEGLGVTVLQEDARFTGRREVTAGDTRISARRVVVATGSTALIPPIAGLEDIDVLTNETIFALTERPDHLIVVGGGPIGCELGQAFRHLGSKVTLVEMAAILPNDDPELVDLLRQRLRADGIDLREGTRVLSAAGHHGGIRLRVAVNGQEEVIEGSRLLLAAGRRPVVNGLDLETAGIAYDGKGIKVDSRLRTTNRKIYAAGDVTGGPQFTHVAGFHAGIVIRNALFRLPARTTGAAVPWVTYCDPELAHVGLTEAAARATHAKLRILRWSFAENDRAQTERRLDGLVKVVTTPRGRILGASILGAQAGELIQPWVLAIANRLKIGAMAGMIAPYPTLGEASKRAAASFFVPKLFSDRTKALVRLLARFG